MNCASKHFHQPEKAKRMVALLSPAQCAAWLDASVDRARRFIASYPAEALIATPQAHVTAKKRTPAKKASGQTDFLA